MMRTILWFLTILTLGIGEETDICGDGGQYEGSEFIRQLTNQAGNQGANGCQCTITAKDSLNLLTRVTYSYQPESVDQTPRCSPLLRWDSEKQSLYNCARLRSDEITNNGSDYRRDDGNNGGNNGDADGEGVGNGGTEDDGDDDDSNESHMHHRSMTAGDTLTFTNYSPENLNLEMTVHITASGGQISISCKQNQQIQPEDVCLCSVGGTGGARDEASIKDWWDSRTPDVRFKLYIALSLVILVIIIAFTILACKGC